MLWLKSDLDLCVERNFLLVMLLVVVRVHSQIMESKLLFYSLLERRTFLQGQAVCLCNDRYNIDKFRKFFQDNNVNGLQTVAGRLDEEEAAVNAGILQVALALSREFLAKVGAVLIFDVLDDRIPATLVVDQVAVPWCINNVQSKSDTILLNNMRDGLDLSCASNRFIWLQTTFAVHEVGCEDGVDECGFAETSLTCKERVSDGSRVDNKINLPTQITLNWKPRFNSFFSICCVMLSKPTWLFGKTVAGECAFIMAIATTAGITSSD